MLNCSSDKSSKPIIVTGIQKSCPVSTVLLIEFKRKSEAVGGALTISNPLIVVRSITEPEGVDAVTEPKVIVEDRAEAPTTLKQSSID